MATTNQVFLTEQELIADAEKFANDPFTLQFQRDSSFMNAVAQKTQELGLIPNFENWKTVLGLLFAEGKVFLKPPTISPAEELELVKLRAEAAAKEIEAEQLRKDLAVKAEAEAKVKRDAQNRDKWAARDREAGSISANAKENNDPHKSVDPNAIYRSREEIKRRQAELEQTRKDNEPVYYSDGPLSGKINHSATQDKRQRIAARRNANAGPHVPSVQEIRASGATQIDVALLKSLPLAQAKEYSRNFRQVEIEWGQQADEVKRQQFGK